MAIAHFEPCMCCINKSKPLTGKPDSLTILWQSAIALYEKKERAFADNFLTLRTQNKVPPLSSLTYTPSSFNQHGKETSFLFCFDRTHNKHSIPNRRLIHKVGKSAFRLRRPIRPVLNSGFRGMKRLGVFLLPLDGMPVHRRVTPQH